MCRIADYPPIEIGKLELNRNPENIFAEVEQSIFSPAPLRAGASAPRPTRCSRAASSRAGDAHRYRVGINADHLPVNRPHATEARTNSRDGYLYDGRHSGRQELRAEQLRRTGPDGPPAVAAAAGDGQHRETVTPVHAEDDDFVQAGALYRLMAEDEKERLVQNLAGFISKVSRDDIAERAINNFRQADGDFGKRLEAAVQALRG